MRVRVWVRIRIQVRVRDRTWVGKGYSQRSDCKKLGFRLEVGSDLRVRVRVQVKVRVVVW